MNCTWMDSAVVLIGSTIILAHTVHAQSAESGRPGPRAVLEPQHELALAVSAAPPAVADHATVLAWNGAAFDTLRAGTNGVTCYVARSWQESLEPHCFDAEGSTTILPIHLRQMQLWHDGRRPEEVDAAIAEGLRSGRFRLPTRPAMSYMMSAGQRLIGDDGTPVGAWRPHLMIYYPYLTPEAMGLGVTPSMDAAVVVDPGTPLSSLMIIVSDFVQVPSIGGDGNGGGGGIGCHGGR